MSISQLSITQVRNLSQANLSLSPHINIFFGQNGAGKTSVLEAVHLLGLAKSFKPARTRSMIQWDQTESVVFCKVGEANLPVGISRKKDGKHQVKISGEPATSSAELASLLPVQLINSDAFLLLEGSSKNRRQFLDWGVFHVEHTFFHQWQRLQKSLKSRNILLRSGKISDPLRDTWDREFIEAATEVDNLRQRFLKGFVKEFERVLGLLIDLPGLKLHYTRGWDKTKTVEEVLKHNLQRDLKSGFTNAGPQRADMKLKIHGELASDVLSRGQQKLVVCALKLAQGYYLSKQTGKQSIYLVDDLPSELDSRHIKLMCQLLEEMDAQAFITCIEQQQLATSWQRHQPKMFHVEHGRIVIAPENGVQK
ncbi:DNA replication/repair protein RecF [Marinicellulosiphila megalodicopiae]|uniref:DNA replication/repair protein RecF n=1 Tax=Marinicellulosiphila megalodicopiae TaxID=2724896 RepID=UPI003BAE2ADF